MSSPRFLGFWIPWHLLGLATVMLVPAAIRFAEPEWNAHLTTQTAAVGLCYLFVVTVLAIIGLRTGRIQLRTATLLTALTLGGVAVALLILPYRGYSRGVFIIGAGLSLLLVAASVLLCGSRWRVRAAVGALAATAIAIPIVGEWPGTGVGTHEQLVLTHHYPLQVGFHGGVVGQPNGSGGAIRNYRDGLLLVTGDGRFMEVAWDSSGPVLRRLPVDVPMNLPDFDAAVPEHVERAYFRVSDVLAEETADGTRIFVTHSFWKRDEACIVLRISETRIGPTDGGGNGAPWRTVYDTEPCIDVPDEPRTFIGELAGGRLARLDERHLLLTVGDHGFDGWRLPEAFAQDRAVDYGKTLSVDVESGDATIFTTGHRNHQGLHIDVMGSIWSTEHGPEGGDELNLLLEGENYGWPYSTLGKEYGGEVWPLNLDREARKAFRSPVFAWIPSIGVSNLLAVRGERFVRWRDDLLVSSLRDGDLFRVRLDGRQVVYVETIPIGARIRDLVETEDGRIVLLVDGGTLVSLLPAEGQGAATFARCAGCHGATNGIGPVLRGVYGREVATASGYRYSRALSRLDGRWTDDRLHAFLADPDSFAPGTTMLFAGVPDSVERRELVRYLKRLR